MKYTFNAAYAFMNDINDNPNWTYFKDLIWRNKYTNQIIKFEYVNSYYTIKYY